MFNEQHTQIVASFINYCLGLTLPEYQTKSLCNFEFVQKFCSMPGLVREKLLSYVSYREVCFQFSFFYFYLNPYPLRGEQNSNPADAFYPVLW